MPFKQGPLFGGMGKTATGTAMDNMAAGIKPGYVSTTALTPRDTAAEGAGFGEAERYWKLDANGNAKPL